MILPSLHHQIVVLLALAAMSMQSWASASAADELLAALQMRLEARQDVDDLIKALDDLAPAVLRNLESQLDKVWPGQQERYTSAFAAAAQDQFGRAESRNNKLKIETLRREFVGIRDMPEGGMKNPLREKSWPALQELRSLLQPSPADVMRVAGERLSHERERLLILARFRNGLIEVRVALSPPFGEDELAAAEDAIMTAFSGLDREGLRVMEKNARLAAEHGLPDPEARGIHELNEMRLLVGLSALSLDPKLCEAARDHSRDMAERGFFSHSSPVKGKETPSKRAERAGTSGSGENIYMGSPKPEAANRGWFFSPGHHKNMFREGYRRVGLGQDGRHWTQMFGR